MKNLEQLRKRLPFRSLRRGEMLFHPFFEVEEYGPTEGYLGILISSHSQNIEPFRLLTEYHGERWTNLTEKRYMAYKRKGNCSSLIVAEFPDRFWFYHFDEQKEEGPIYSIAFLPVESINEFTIVETKKFRATRREIRTMLDHLLINHKNIVPVEHGIPYRGYIKEMLAKWRKYKGLTFRKEWKVGGRFTVAAELDLPNLQFYLQAGYKDGIFSLKNTRTRIVNNPEHFIDYLTAFDYKENKAIHVARKEDKISGRKFIYGFLANEKIAILFEEDQPLIEIELEEDGWEYQVEDLITAQFNRLGDIVFWRIDTMVPSFMEKITWEELKEDPKISIAEYSNRKIVCHHGHGCTKVYPLEHPHRLRHIKYKIVIS